MLVIVLVGVLSALSFPLYSQHVVQAKRLAAQIQLLKLASVLEQYALVHATYQTATLEGLGFPQQVVGSSYQFVIAKQTATDFLLQAIPQGQQAQQDQLCGTLWLDAAGRKGGEKCWQ